MKGADVEMSHKILSEPNSDDAKALFKFMSIRSNYKCVSNVQNKTELKYALCKRSKKAEYKKISELIIILNPRKSSVKNMSISNLA